MPFNLFLQEDGETWKEHDLVAYQSILKTLY